MQNHVSERVYNEIDKVNANQMRQALQESGESSDSVILWMREYWADVDERKQDRKLARQGPPYIPKTMSPEERTRIREQQKERAKFHRIRHKYGLEREDYYRMLDEQGNRCLICATGFGKTKPCIDHCHRTGRIRGMLCTACNTMLGSARDDPDVLIAGIRYLEESRS